MAFMRNNEESGKPDASKEEKNVSNSTAWVFGTPQIDPAVINLPRNTEQCFVLIIYNDYESTFNKFRNSIMVSRNIMRAYGHGEYFGQSKKHTIRCVDGYWSHYHSMGMLSFDNRRAATMCCESTKELREWHWLGGVEMYITPLCQPPKCSSTYRFIQMDLYDVKHCTNFVRYLDQMVPLVADHNGLVIAGSQEVGRWKGTKFPNYIVLIQWPCPEDFDAFFRIGAPMLRDAGAACASRIFLEISPPETQW